MLTSSCHPTHITENIPFSLALRIVRICTHPEDREKRFSELKSLLLSRNYKPRSIDAAIEKARKNTKGRSSEKSCKNSNSKRPVFVINFDPRLPSITDIVRKHWRTMIQDPRLCEIFPLPPLVAYKRPPNIKQKLIRAKIPPPTSRPKRDLKTMKKCFKCAACPFIKEGRKIEATQSNFKIDINVSANWLTTNIIYMLGCKRCPQQYVGESERSLKERFLEHIRHHLAPFGTIRQHPAPFGTIRQCSVPFHTIWYHSALFGTIWHHLLPFGTIWYHSVPFSIICYNLAPFNTI